MLREGMRKNVELRQWKAPPYEWTSEIEIFVKSMENCWNVLEILENDHNLYIILSYIYLWRYGTFLRLFQRIPYKRNENFWICEESIAVLWSELLKYIWERWDSTRFPFPEQ